jgi:F-type H+-transporting ATPase subunit b
MQELFTQLGIDWKLLLSQAVNFGLLLIILTFFAYKPLLRTLKERRTKIEEGLAKAEEADARLREAHRLKTEKLKEAEQEAIVLMQRSEAKMKEHEAKLLAEAKKKELELLSSAERLAKAKQDEAAAAARKEAAALVKEALVKTVELNPNAVDEALIARAVEQTTGHK